MRILHLNTYASGGSYEYAALLSNALANERIDSRVLCRGPAPSTGDRQVLNRLVRRISVSLSRETWHGAWRFLPPPGRGELEGVDLVHLHTVGDWFNVPRWLRALPAHIGVVVSLHDLWHVSGGCFVYRGCERFADTCSPCPILKPPVHRLLARRELAWKWRTYRDRHARLVANSRWLADTVAQSVTARACGGVQVVSPAIDTTVFKPRDKRRCREEMGLPSDKFILVTGCASLTDVYKNTPWLLERLAQLPDLKETLVVAFGDGRVPVPDGLNVRFTGAIRDRRALAGILAAADVCVSASQMETYGLTLVEAMACGTPVVAFRVGGIPEAAPDGQAAILCAWQDGDALLAAITQLKKSPEVRRRLGEAASELALTRNAPGAFANSYARIYQECLVPVGNTCLKGERPSGG